jgi:AdoMet-dependent heme synthase
LSLDFSRRPLLVFWETTRACGLACRHCRASALPHPLPGELTAAEGRDLVRQVAAFGRPHPVLVLTGGDCLARPDIFELAGLAAELGIHPAMSPSVTPRLEPASFRRMREAGVSVVSISLDGAQASTHERIRGIDGHFGSTIAAIRGAVAAGLKVQVNTAVMRDNLEQLPEVAALLVTLGVNIWEVFFLVVTGRAAEEAQVSASECEDACHLLYDASGYGFVVRTVEAPFFRRVAAWRRDRGPLGPVAVTRTFGLGDYYRRSALRLRSLLGEPIHRPAAQTVSTRDGSGIVFIAHNGDVYPAGFLPLPLGNVRERPLAEIYRDHELLRAIRNGDFHGRCAVCAYRQLCGGSRARAYASTGDPLGEDPACSYRPLVEAQP